MSYGAEVIFKRISDFWSLMPQEDRNAIAAYWQAMVGRAADLNLAVQQFDWSKSIGTVPVVFRSTDVPLIFDTTTRLTESRSGYPYGYSTRSTITEIPTLVVGFEVATATLRSGTDYIVEEGKIFFVVEPPQFMVAPSLGRNLELVWRNFGYLLNFYRQNSTSYRRRVQGLWFALFGGATIANIQLGMSALLDLPFTKGGLVKAIRVQPDGSANVEVGEEVINVPKYLVPKISVSVGDNIDGYRAIVSAVTVEDWIINPDIAAKAGIPRVKEWFTFLVTVDADDVVEMIGPLGSIDALFDGSIDFIERAKPAYVDFVAGVLKELGEEEDSLTFATESEPRIVTVRMPSTVNFNPVNIHFGITTPNMQLPLASLDYDAYVAQGGDRRLNLDADDMVWSEFLQITDIPLAGPNSPLYELGTDIT